MRNVDQKPCILHKYNLRRHYLLKRVQKSQPQPVAGNSELARAVEIIISNFETSAFKGKYICVLSFLC